MIDCRILRNAAINRKGLADALRHVGSTYPTKLGIIDLQGSRTWSELVAEVDRRADELHALGTLARVVLLLEQDRSAVALMAACDAVGVTALCVSALYGEDKARALLEPAGADRVLAIRDGVVVELARREASARAASPPEVLLLSSGTTGAFKCIRHTWTGLANAVSTRDDRDQDRWLLAYPISHFAALQVLTQSVWSGATLVIPRDFGPAAAVAALDEHDVTCLSCTPTYFRRLLLAAPAELWTRTKLRHLTLGGEIAGQPLLDAARRALPDARVLHIYASTELGAAITVRDGLEGFDAALLDGEHLKIEAGELWARRTPRTMLGYEGGGAATEWIATGDLVEVRQGRVRFCGRTNDIINIGGFKVNPADVETVAREVAGVAEVWIVGHKSSITGHVIKAVVCVAPGADGAVVRREIAALCAARLPAHMVPRLFEITDRVETSWTQKLLRPA